MPTYGMGTTAPTDSGLGMFNWNALFGGMPSWLSRAFRQGITPQPARSVYAPGSPAWRDYAFQLWSQLGGQWGPQGYEPPPLGWPIILGRGYNLAHAGYGTSAGPGASTYPTAGGGGGIGGGGGGGGIGLGSLTNLMGTMLQAQLAQQRLAQERDLALRGLALRGIESAGQLGLGAGQLGLGMMQNVVSPYHQTAMRMPTGAQVTGAMRYF